MLPLPEPLLIDETVTTPFMYPRSKSYPLTESWELGGVAIGDSSEDLTKYNWKAWTDGSVIKVKRGDLNTYRVMLTDINITEVDLTFDQNMHLCIAYVSDGVAKLYWYDSEQATQTTTVFPNIKNPRVSLDDKRRFNVSNSDIIFAYLREDNLCYRLQRERYGVEHLLHTDPQRHVLWKIGMGVNNRFLFYWRYRWAK